MTAHANIKSDVAFNFLKIITPLLFIWGEGRSEDNSQELILSFHQVGSEDKTQVIRLYLKSCVSTHWAISLAQDNDQTQINDFNIGAGIWTQALMLAQQIFLPTRLSPDPSIFFS